MLPLEDKLKVQKIIYKPNQAPSHDIDVKKKLNKEGADAKQPAETTAR